MRTKESKHTYICNPSEIKGYSLHRKPLEPVTNKSVHRKN